MACPINNDEIAKLKMFVQFAAQTPQILNMPQLEFFKKFVEQLGGKVPEGGNFQHSRLDNLNFYQIFSINFQLFDSANAEAKAESFTAPPPQPKGSEAESEPESDVELDLLDTVVQPDTDACQEMGNENKEATEEEMDQADELRGKAAKAYSNGEFEGKI